MEEAWHTWLGDLFEEDDRVALLKVALTGPTYSEVDYELVVFEPVPVAQIELLTPDLDSIAADSLASLEDKSLPVI